MKIPKKSMQDSRRLLVILFFTCCSCLTFGQMEVSEWVKVEAIDKSCSIFAPYKMSLVVDSLEVDIGKIYNVHHIIQADPLKDPNFLYQMSYTTYPPGAIPIDSMEIIQDMLDMTLQQSVMAQNGELIYSAHKNYKDYPGRIWRTTYNNGQYAMKSLAFFSPDHLYLVHVATLQDNASNRAVDHFLNSFKIVDP